MKQISLLILVATLLLSCGNRKRSIQNIEGKSVEIENIEERNIAQTVVYSVDELLANTASLVDTEVKVKGTVVHVCQQHAGKRCQLMGSNENINIKVEAGEKIGAFMQEQMGSDLTIAGILRERNIEPDKHDSNRGQGEGRQAADRDGRRDGKGRQAADRDGRRDGKGRQAADREGRRDGKGQYREDSSGRGNAEKAFFLQGVTVVKEEY